jgi:hypothetical protein
MHNPDGSLFDVVTNGTLSGFNVVVIHRTILNADVNGIANNTLLKLCV